MSLALGEILQKYAYFVLNELRKVSTVLWYFSRSPFLVRRMRNAPSGAPARANFWDPVRTRLKKFENAALFLRQAQNRIH